MPIGQPFDGDGPTAEGSPQSPKPALWSQGHRKRKVVYRWRPGTAGMSSAETRDTVDLIRRISEGLAILIVEHDMDVVMELAQRITVLNYGEVLAEGTPAEIQHNPRVLEVYLKT